MEEDILFCQEKASELEEHYKALTNATKAYLFPWDFKPLGWYPETKDWSSNQKVLATFLMPYIAFDVSFDKEWSNQLFSARFFSFFLWAFNYFVLIIFSLALGTVIKDPSAPSTSQNNEVGVVGWFFIVYVLVFVFVIYAHTIWYFLNKKTSWIHRLFIIGCTLMISIIISGEIRPYINNLPHTSTFMFFIFVATSWVPFSLSTSMCLIIIIKYLILGMATRVIYLLRAHSTDYSFFTNELIFGDKNKPAHTFRLISVSINEIRYLKELSQKSLENTEKKTTPAAILLTFIGVLFAFTPFSGWVVDLFETSTQFMATSVQDDLFAGIATIFLVSAVMIIFPLSLLIVARQYVNLLGNLYVQGIIVEACTVAEYTKVELEKKNSKQVTPRTPWQIILDWIFGRIE